MQAISTQNLTKKFGDFTAVDKVSLNIQQGELFGLLGPNGAGKTTFISMLSTILNITEGSAKVSDYDVKLQPSKVRNSIGIVFQDTSSDDELTGYENLDFHGRLYHMPKDLREERIKYVLDLVELDEFANKLLKTYSGGMRRRLEIARGLMHKPKILFLDEPTLGLDPQTRRKIWQYIKKMNKEEKVTMLLTTHYMEEADFLCNRIAIIDHGQIIANDTPNNLKKVVGESVITLGANNLYKLEKNFTNGYVKDKKILNDKLILTVDDEDKALAYVTKIAAKLDVDLNSIQLHKPNLEDVFIHYTGRNIREEKWDKHKQLMSRVASIRRR